MEKDEFKKHETSDFSGVLKVNNNNGLKFLIVLLILIILGLIGYICYDKGVFNDLLEKYKIIKKEEPKEELSEEDSLELSEGFVKVQYHGDAEYKVYSVIAYGNSISSYVVSVNDALYWVRPLENDQTLACIEKIVTAKFDSSNKYICKTDQDRTDKADYDAEIYKFEGKASDLVKATSSIAYYSTDGSKYPILIYNSGNVESVNKDTDNVLKDYKIKDFIEEKCEKFDDNMKCENGKLVYKVILQDGTEKTIVK